jgi:hypothetical protein
MITAAAATARRGSRHADAARTAAHTASATMAASGRYIRRSAPTSVAMGTKLDVRVSWAMPSLPASPEASTGEPGAQTNSDGLASSRK